MSTQSAAEAATKVVAPIPYNPCDCGSARNHFDQIRDMFDRRYSPHSIAFLVGHKGSVQTSVMPVMAGIKLSRAKRVTASIGARASVTKMTKEEALGWLGIKSDANEEAIKTAYRAQSLRTHPDKGGTAMAFQSVKTAYETLGGA
jgi:hypothetical protein